MFIEFFIEKPLEARFEKPPLLKPPSSPPSTLQPLPPPPARGGGSFSNPLREAPLPPSPNYDGACPAFRAVLDPNTKSDPRKIYFLRLVMQQLACLVLHEKASVEGASSSSKPSKASKPFEARLRRRKPLRLRFRSLRSLLRRRSSPLPLKCGSILLRI